jgi:hypothetical protein
MIGKLLDYFWGWLDGNIPAKDAHLMDDVIDTSPMQYRTNRRPGDHKDLRDVIVFKGPSGVYQVSQEESAPLGEHHPFWVVDKIVEKMEIAYNDGESHHKTIHPRSGTDRNVGGSFRKEQVAMDSARKWAGVPELVEHPVPNRRAAIAHTKAQA